MARRLRHRSLVVPLFALAHANITISGSTPRRFRPRGPRRSSWATPGGPSCSSRQGAGPADVRARHRSAVMTADRQLYHPLPRGAAASLPKAMGSEHVSPLAPHRAHSAAQVPDGWPPARSAASSCGRDRVVAAGGSGVGSEPAAPAARTRLVLYLSDAPGSASWPCTRTAVRGGRAREDAAGRQPRAGGRCLMTARRGGRCA
jgi:hypothetical protein